MKRIYSLAIALSAFFMATAQNNVRLKYPETEKTDQQDNYFGTIVKDPYRWLEDDNADKVKSWVAQENKLTQDYLAQIPYREKIKTRITDLMNFPRYIRRESRDFFYMTLRPLLPGPKLALGRDPGFEGEGRGTRRNTSEGSDASASVGRPRDGRVL